MKNFNPGQLVKINFSYDRYRSWNGLTIVIDHCPGFNVLKYVAVPFSIERNNDYGPISRFPTSCRLQSSILTFNQCYLEEP